MGTTTTPTDRPAPAPARRGRIDPGSVLLALVIVAMLTIGGTGRPPNGDAAPPPADRFAHGAAGTARNGHGGQIAPSPTIESWPGTGPGRNGGSFAFVGAQYGSLWSIPPAPNNSLGVGYCVMEDVGGEGVVTRRPDPEQWDVGEMARAAAVMATFGGDRVIPYGIDALGPYDVTSGEWHHPALLGGGEYTRRRQVAVNFAVKMFVEDVSPSGVAAGRKLARDTAVVAGTGGEFAALRNGYAVAQRIAGTAEVQHAVGGVRLHLVWGTPDGAAPVASGVYPLEVRATDATGKAVGFVPVAQLSGIGIDGNRSVGAVATVDQRRDGSDDTARWTAAETTGWPTWDLVGSMAHDGRFALPDNRLSADVADAAGIARFTVAIAGPSWELAFHAQAPTADVTLHSGSGVQGQVTWSGPPQSASVHQRVVAPGRFTIRKVLDAADIQGDRDMSGFTFDVVAADGTAFGRHVTGADGRTPPIVAPPGDYRLIEVARPAWATALGDRGPVDVRLESAAPPGAAPDVAVREVTYINAVPTATLTTFATDAADGDKYLADRRLPDGHLPDQHLPDQHLPDRHLPDRYEWDDPDSVRVDAGVPAVVDRLRYTGLVPGTPYVARGELVGVEGACSDCPPVVARAETPFVPATPDGHVDVVFELSDEESLRGDTIVALQRIVVAASGRVVAEHADRTDRDQTVYVPAVTTNLRRAGDTVAPVGWAAREVVTGDAVTDVVAWSGLAIGERYRLEMSLQQRLADGTCVPIGATTSVELVPDAHGGVVEMSGLAVPGPGVFVAFQHVFAGDRMVAAHLDCGDEHQTLWVADPTQPSTTTPSTTTPSTTPSTTTPSTTPATTTAATTPTTAPPARPASIARPLPRTGGSGAGNAVALGAGLLLCGAGLAILARSPLRRPRRVSRARPDMV